MGFVLRREPNDGLVKKYRRIGLTASADHPNLTKALRKEKGTVRSTIFVGNSEVLRQAFGRSGGLDVAKAIAKRLSGKSPKNFKEITAEVVKEFGNREIHFNGITGRVNEGLVLSVFKRLIRMRLVKRVESVPKPRRA